MGTKHPNPNRIKALATYSVDEIARLLDVCKGTVRRWIKDGLQCVDGPGLLIVRGSDLRAFLRQRREKAKRPCGPGFLYCLRCRMPKQPTNNIADIVHVNRGKATAACISNLRGVCPACGNLMFRRVNIARLEAVRGDLRIAMPENTSRITGVPSPSVNDHFNKDEASHEKVQRTQ